MAASRGPVKGRGGRRTTDAKKRQPAKPNGKPIAFADELSKLTFPELQQLASRWRKLESQDAVAIAQLWEAVKRYRTLAAYVHSLPIGKWTFQTETGYEQQIPQLGLLSTALKQCLELAGRFGMTPADRARLGTPPPADNGETKFSQHMSRVGDLSGEVRD